MMNLSRGGLREMELGNHLGVYLNAEENQENLSSSKCRVATACFCFSRDRDAAAATELCSPLFRSRNVYSDVEYARSFAADTNLVATFLLRIADANRPVPFS
jgi:hypothetical protein